MLSTGGKKWIADLQTSERKRTGISSLKVGYNKPTIYQWAWIEMLRQKDYIAEVCYDLDSAISVIETYMGGFIE